MCGRVLFTSVDHRRDARSRGHRLRVGMLSESTEEFLRIDLACCNFYGASSCAAMACRCEASNRWYAGASLVIPYVLAEENWAGVVVL
jgi:hypothetical protein